MGEAPSGASGPPAGLATILAPLLAAPSRTGVFLDFDGTLAEIVARPELATSPPDAAEVLRRLATRYAVVALVSGRTTGQLRHLVDVPGIVLFGLYGLEALRPGTAVPPGTREEATRAAAEVAGAWVEDKGASLAVHYRQAADPDRAADVLRSSLEEVAARMGLALLPGRLVLELAPRGTPGKGQVILHEARSRKLSACLYAGDDRADLQAFAALEALRAEGVVTVKVAVRSAESPPELIHRADLTVSGPAGVLEVLSFLAS